MATVPLATGTVDVYAYASRWSPSHVLVSWQDEDWHSHWAALGMDSGCQRPPSHRLRMGYRRIPTLPQGSSPCSVGRQTATLPARAVLNVA
jgi:hypothetical protein